MSHRDRRACADPGKGAHSARRRHVTGGQEGFEWDEHPEMILFPVS